MSTQPLDLLKQLKEQKGRNGVSLHEHLCQLFEKLRKENPKEAYEAIEKISAFVKRNAFEHKTPKFDNVANTKVDYSTDLTEWYNECQKVLDKYTLEDSKGKKTMSQSLGAVQDLNSHAKILASAGVSFGEEETYLLSKSLTRLAARANARELRFWGKIFGTENDYWIAEGLLNHENSDDPVSPEIERHGEGCNRLTFWVTNDVLGDWQQLPLVTPEQMRISRLIKKTFTGDLEAKIESYPEFPGSEKHYLKAQIVRITFANVIIPDGMRQQDEEDEKKEELQFVEDSKYPDWETVSNKENWVHYHPNVLQAGRVRHYIPPEVTEEEVEEKEAELTEKDPYVPRLQKIVEDKLSEDYVKENDKFQIYKIFKKPPEEGSEEKPIQEWEDKDLWSQRTFGDKQMYATENDEGQVAYAVVAFKNLLWPGHITVASPKDFVNVYIGYGHKIITETVDPNLPGVTNDDPEDPDEFPEPYPHDGPPKDPVPEDEEGGDGAQDDDDADA